MKNSASSKVTTKLFLEVIDRWVGAPPPPPRPLNVNPKKVLLVQLAHLGDAVIATGMIRLVRKKWPQAEVGILCGSWSRGVFEGHPGVSSVHIYDHWKLNRSGPWPQWGSVALPDYDLAIALSPYFPNGIPLIYKAAIPVRIGFTNGGYGGWLTHAHAWEEGLMHEQQARLIDEKGEPPWLIKPPRLIEEPYTLLHPGCHDPKRQWDHWGELARKIGGKIFVTGRGKKEWEIASAIGNAQNWVDRDGWISLIAHADLMIATDSAAAHIASAFQTPSVVLFNIPKQMAVWAPSNPRAINLKKPTVSEVLAAIEDHLLHSFGHGQDLHRCKNDQLGRNRYLFEGDPRSPDPSSDHTPHP